MLLSERTYAKLTSVAFSRSLRYLYLRLALKKYNLNSMHSMVWKILNGRYILHRTRYRLFLPLCCIAQPAAFDNIRIPGVMQRLALIRRHRYSRHWYEPSAFLILFFALLAGYFGILFLATDTNTTKQTYSRW